jgi:hypothetical protein
VKKRAPVRQNAQAFWAEERSDDGSKTPESLRSDSGQSLRARQPLLTNYEDNARKMRIAGSKSYQRPLSKNHPAFRWAFAVSHTVRLLARQV